jgi:hypothetical protein
MSLNNHIIGINGHINGHDSLLYNYKIQYGEESDKVDHTSMGS